MENTENTKKTMSRCASLSQRQSAFTRIELIVVILVIGLLAVLVMPAISRARATAGRIYCNNNLKCIGTGYRLWAGDHGDLVPTLQTVKSNGWQDFLTNANEGAICWTNYFIMQNELGQTPKLLLCPADERKPATSFTNNFDNTHVSYFVGVNANDIYPQSIQGGDRNLGPGTKPDPDYGYSPKSGKGNDVTLPLTDPVSWSLKMHSAGKTPTAGNILFGDGSVQQCSSAAFNSTWLPNAAGTNNWPAGQIPATPSIRLLFP
jgi:prepilin-type processing-associated H-X9-DG protein